MRARPPLNAQLVLMNFKTSSYALRLSGIEMVCHRRDGRGKSVRFAGEREGQGERGREAGGVEGLKSGARSVCKKGLLGDRHAPIGATVCRDERWWSVSRLVDRERASSKEAPEHWWRLGVRRGT